MKRGLGAVAAGHPATAQAGAEVLERGGNAVDAVVGMVCAASVCEPTLTSLGGGGFLMVQHPENDPVVVDCFVRAPGLGPRHHVAPWGVFDLDLGDAILSYGIGPASVAVPGIVAGIAEASSRWGRLSMLHASLPAIGLAEGGVRVTAEQAYELELNADMFRDNHHARTTFLDRGGQPYREGDIVRQPALAAAIEELAATGGRSMYEGAIAHAICAWSDATGGRIAFDDLASYRPIIRTPHTVRIGDAVVHTNPSPAYGGVLVAELLTWMHDRHGIGWRNLRGTHDERAMNASLVEAQLSILALDRRPPRTIPPMPGEQVLHHEDAVVVGSSARSWSRSPNTSHISAIDADGMHASVTFTVGYGSGEWIPGFGIQFNNMLAEYDHRIVRAPGTTIPSMMTPTIWSMPGRLLSIGSAGADRIPAALAHICTRAGGYGMSLDDAVCAPRSAFNGEILDLEPGFDAADVPGVPARHWGKIDGYFGTSNGVGMIGNRFEAAGDPRRGCAGILIDS